MNFKKLLGELMRTMFEEPKPQQKQPRKPQSTRRQSTSRKSSGRVSQSTRVYGEEPILMRGTDMLRQVPPKIRQMRTLSGFGVDGQRSMESLFVQQGRFMADFTDDFEQPVHCARSMPMYYNLKDDELRCYFTWRTRYRAGMLPPAESPYLLLYCSELINLIGVPSAAESYERLKQLYSDYAETNPDFAKKLARWLPDFAAYYQLPYSDGDKKGAAVAAVLRHTEHTAAELLAALNTLSKYRILESKLYAAHPDETAGAVQAAYTQLLLHYAQVKGQSLPGFLFGGRQRASHEMFEGAVFYEPNRALVRAAYRVSPMLSYSCYGGQWAVERFCGEPDTARIGAILRTADSVLREELHFKSKLKPGDLPVGDAQVIRAAILAYFEAEKRRNAPKIELDAAELSAIRAAAEHTTDMLTLEEEESALPEKCVLPEELPENLPVQTEETEITPENLPELPLSKPALALLICLLTNESYQPLIDAGQMISVLADEINEALYDRFGDTVLETDDAGNPALIADYADELRAMFEG